MPCDVPARILSHQALNPDHLLLTLQAPAIARSARPGQFVMMATRSGTDPLLRRPMSIFRVLPGSRGRIQVLYKIVGAGTRYLSQHPAGTDLATIGPLGNGFHLPPRARIGSRNRPVLPVLVAGGIGIAVFPFLVDALRARSLRPLLLFGGRSRGDLVGLPFFRSQRVEYRLTTEDGTAGVRGYVTRLVEPLLNEPEIRPSLRLFACGPTPMLKAIGSLATKFGVPCQLALEATMPCGIGVCLGCVVQCPGEGDLPTYKRVCTEGPIFEASEVAL